MPKVYKVLSGDEVVKILLGHGFYFKTQKGSHMKVYFAGPNMNGAVIVPRMKELRQGTLKSVIDQAAIYVNEKDLEKDFKN